MAVTFTIKKQQPKDENVLNVISDMQTDLITVMNQLNRLISVQMILITDVSLNSTDATLVAHNLGFQARGFFVVDKTASVDVYRDTALANPDPLRFIALRTAAGSATVSLVCF